MTKSPFLWTLTALVATSSASAQESGPISRFIGRFRSSPTPTHQHVHVEPAPAPYVYQEPQTEALVYEPAVEPMVIPEPAYLPEPAPLAEAVAPVVEMNAEEVATEYAATEAYHYGGDPYGFIHILNQIRTAAGLHPLAYDSNLASWAQQNNAEQCRRGLGHHVNPGGLQNCAYNYSDANSTAAGWMNSPGHRQNMLSPSATHFGIAFGPGPYWTLNAR